jgi:hypothetical protein
LRSSARSARINIHGIAEQVVGTRESPEAVIRGLGRVRRLRAIATREWAETTAERSDEVQRRHVEQLVRLAQNRWEQKPTARIRTDRRSDAVELASRLGGYRWYLIVPDEEHWDVVVEFSGAPNDLPADLRTRIDEWLRACSLQAADVRIADLELKLLAAEASTPERSRAEPVR